MFYFCIPLSKAKKFEPLILELQATKITDSSFLHAVKSFFGFINEIANEIANEEKAITWLVKAESGSLKIIVEPDMDIIEGDVAIKTVDIIHRGLPQLEKSDERPDYFNDSALKHLRDLAMPNGDKSKQFIGIKVRSNTRVSPISIKTYANIETILGTYRMSPGSVEGKLAVLSDRTQFQFYIDDLITGHSVRCEIHKEMEREVLDAFRKRVIATGDVKYRRDGEAISIIVKEFRIIGGKELPSYKDVRGILKDRG